MTVTIDNNGAATLTNNQGTSCRPLVLLAIAIAAVIFIFPLLLRFPLLDPDEGLHASIAQEMVERGDWIVPRFLGQPFFDKPILYFWIQAASLRLFGWNETAVRLPGLMFGLLGAVTTGLLAWRMFGRKTGWIAGIFYATTILPTALAQAASHDVALVPWVNLAMLLLWDAECRRRLRAPIPELPSPAHGRGAGGEGVAQNPRTPFSRAILACWPNGAGRRLLQPFCETVGAGLFLGLSILTKGLLGVAVVGLAFGGYLLIARRVTIAALLQATAVLLIAVAVAAPWYLAVEARQAGFLHYYFFERHVLGFATGKQPHSDQPWWYYLPILLGGGLPWIAYLRWAAGGGRDFADDRLAVASTRRGITGAFRSYLHFIAAWTRRLNAGSQSSTADSPPSALPFLWFWLIGWVVFLTVARSKLATYLWPAFPPLAILAAVAWTRAIAGSLGAIEGDRPIFVDTKIGTVPGEAARRSFARSFVSSCWGGPIVLPAAVAVLQSALAFRFAWPVWLAVIAVAAVSPLPLVPWRGPAAGGHGGGGALAGRAVRRGDDVDSAAACGNVLRPRFGRAF